MSAQAQLRDAVTAAKVHIDSTPFVRYAVYYALPAYLAWRLLWSWVVRTAFKTTTCLSDIPLVGTARKGGKLSGTVVIAGCSIGGLMSSRMLSDHFDKIVVFEPDTVVGGEKRSRVGQYGQVHAFHHLCHEIPERLFPGFRKDIERVGGRLHPIGLWNFILGAKRLTLDPRTTPTQIGMTRMGYENVLRARVMSQTPGLEFLVGTVTGITTADGENITSVQYRLNNDTTIHSMPCDLFIDCTGPGASGAKWITRPTLANGVKDPAWGPINKIQYNPHVSYSCATVKVSPQLLASLPPSPEHPQCWHKGGMLYSVVPSSDVDSRTPNVFMCDNSQIMFGSACKGNIDLPNTLEEYKTFINDTAMVASGAPCPDWINGSIDKVLDASKDEGGPQIEFLRYKFGVSFVQKFHEAKKLPRNFIALGDSFMRVNPTFGQGTSKAASNSVTLNAVLHRTNITRNAKTGRLEFPKSFAYDYFKTELGRTMPLYDFNKTMDLGSPHCEAMDEGESNETGAPIRYFLDGALQLAGNDPNLAALIVKVMVFGSPAVVLNHPVLLVRGFWARFWNGHSQPAYAKKAV